MKTKHLSYDQYHVLDTAATKGESIVVSTSQYFPDHLPRDWHCSSAMLQGLERRGLIERDGCWRFARVTITDAGKEYLAAFEKAGHRL